MALNKVRRASHAGSWYSNSARELRTQVSELLAAAAKAYREQGADLQAPVKAVISPHAGLSWSGPTAAFAYSRLQPASIKRIFLLGPSHHHYTDKCLLTQASVYQTPLGDIPIDQEITKELLKFSSFDVMSTDVDEAEHSLEMQLPFIAHIMKDHDYKLVPIMVGHFRRHSPAHYGAILSQYFDTPGNVFVISSDFCHWGRRFGFTYYDQAVGGEVWKNIEVLDHQGMKLIEEQSPQKFADYLERTKNTICGRNPISLLLETLQHSDRAASASSAAESNDSSTQKKEKEQDKGPEAAKPRHQIRFTRYAQSSKAKNHSDSSVSYATAIITETRSSGRSNDKEKDQEETKRPEDFSDEDNSDNE